jgi:hypothetical protein
MASEESRRIDWSTEPRWLTDHLSPPRWVIDFADNWKRIRRELDKEEPDRG